MSKKLSSLFELLSYDERNLNDPTVDSLDRAMAAYGALSVISSLHNSHGIHDKGMDFQKPTHVLQVVEAVKIFVDEQRRDPDPVFTPRQAEEMASVAAGLQKALGTNQYWQMPSTYIQAFVS